MAPCIRCLQPCIDQKTGEADYLRKSVKLAQPTKALREHHPGSLKRSFLGFQSIPKGGAGGHNWGSLDSELRYEDDALLDEAADFEDRAKETGSPNPTKPAAVRRTSSVTDEDRANAIKVRKNALKSDGTIDLAAIARSSVAVSGSPPKDGTVV